MLRAKFGSVLDPDGAPPRRARIVQRPNLSPALRSRSEIVTSQSTPGFNRSATHGGWHFRMHTTYQRERLGSCRKLCSQAARRAGIARLPLAAPCRSSAFDNRTLNGHM